MARKRPLRVIIILWPVQECPSLRMSNLWKRERVSLYRTLGKRQACCWKTQLSQMKMKLPVQLTHLLFFPLLGRVINILMRIILKINRSRETITTWIWLHTTITSHLKTFLTRLWHSSQECCLIFRVLLLVQLDRLT